jgi:EAL domain-containing protein (putative c-di-GMP-specific phosphodiesterase class I)
MKGSRLLIVDDEVEIGDFVTSVAESCGYAVNSVSSATEFFSRFERWRPSHILLDMRMPDSDGVELLRFLVEQQCRAQVVVLSGAEPKILESVRHLARGRGLDIAAVLRKPIRAAQLRTVLEDLKRPSHFLDEAAILDGIANQQFRLVYQPKVSLRAPACSGGRLSPLGFEGLLRWHHPLRGEVLPGEFVPLAETMSLMDELTNFVISEGISQLREWLDKGLDTSLALNLSGANLHAPDFADHLYRRCREANVAPELVTLELTETAAMADPVRAMDILTRLRLKGYQLSLDDFGTGYSSLVQLQRLPFSELKIDRALIADCASSRQSRIIVKTAIDLARNLGMVACAEGIENAAELALLQELNCEVGQGFHFARPMAPAEAEAWLSQ